MKHRSDIRGWIAAAVGLVTLLGVMLGVIVTQARQFQAREDAFNKLTDRVCAIERVTVSEHPEYAIFFQRMCMKE